MHSMCTASIQLTKWRTPPTAWHIATHSPRHRDTCNPARAHDRRSSAACSNPAGHGHQTMKKFLR